MLKLILLAGMLNSCVALAQDELPLMDFTVATEMPAFSLVDMRNGETFHSAQHSDAAFLLEFYFQSCPACNQNAPNVKRLAEVYKDNPKVKILEVSIDCQGYQYERWIDDHSPISPVLNACNADLVDVLEVSRFPTTYVFAPNGREAMRGTGVWSAATYERLKRYLDQVK